MKEDILARSPAAQREEEKRRAEYFRNGGVVHRYPMGLRTLPRVWGGNARLRRTLSNQAGKQKDKASGK